MQIKGFIGCLLAASVSFGSANAFAGVLSVRATPNGNVLEGRDAEGAVVWRRNEIGPLQVEQRPDGNYLANGHELVGRDGRLLARLDNNAGAGAQIESPIPFTTAAETWSPTTNMLSYAAFATAAVVFDKDGNEWTTLEDPTTVGGVFVKSDGLTGAWNVVATVQDPFWGSSMSTDPQGDITAATYVTNTATGTSLFQLRVVRYEPATGFSAAQILYSEPTSAGATGYNVYVTSDSQGDAVVVADLSQYGAAYWVFSSATQAWSGPTAMPLPISVPPLGVGGYSTVLGPALATSPNQKNIEYIYTAMPGTSGAVTATGVFVNKFDPTTKTFGSPVMVPDSAGTDAQINYGCRIPGFVDNNGVVSVIWVNKKHKHHISTWASRYENGQWSSKKVYKTELLYDEFSDQAIDSNGDLLASYPASLAGYTQNITVLKYINGKGWSSEVPYTWSSVQSTRQRIAWLGNAGKIVEVFMLSGINSTDYYALSSMIYDGSTWAAPTAIPPGNQYSFLQEIASDANGNVGLVFDPVDEGSGTSSTSGAFSTFMTP